MEKIHNMEKIKGLTIFTKNKKGQIQVFEIENLNQIEGYGKYSKNRIAKIVGNVLNKIGVLKYSNGDKEIKIDLTQQIVKPKFHYYE